MVEGEQKWWHTLFFAHFVLGICGTGGSGHGFCFQGSIWGNHRELLRIRRLQGSAS